MVKWSKTSRDAIKDIHDFIARDSKHYAKIVTRKIADYVNELVEFPKKGRIVPERNDENLREIIIYSYRVIYRIMGEDIFVINVLHGRQNAENKI